MYEVKGPVSKYQAALTVAWGSLVEKDLSELARYSGSKLEAKVLHLPFFDRDLTVDIHQQRLMENSVPAEEPTAILALHYLHGCSEAVPAGELISFAQAPGGEVYFSAFKQRSIEKVLDLFGADPELLLITGARIGGEEVKAGSAAIRVHLFPKLPITIILWQGDEEVLPSGNILFDKTAPSILPTEDLAVAASLVVSRLKKTLIEAST